MTDRAAAAFSCLVVLEVLTGGIFGKTAGVEKGICAGCPAEAEGGGFGGDLRAADACCCAETCCDLDASP